MDKEIVDFGDVLWCMIDVRAVNMRKKILKRFFILPIIF